MQRPGNELNQPRIPKKWAVFSTWALFLMGCTSSGVLQLGPDTYSVATSNELSPALAKKSALRDAQEFCQSKGRHIMPVEERSGSHVDSFGDNIATYDFMFRCLETNDPALTRPEIRNPTLDVNVTKNVNVSGSPTQNVQPKDTDLYTELQKLEQLRVEGILTDDEFRQAKKKLLEKY